MPKKKLNRRQKKFLEVYVDTQGDKVAAFKSQYTGACTDKRALQKMADNYYRHLVRNTDVEEHFQLEGLGRGAVVESLKNGLKANRKTFFQGETISEDPDWQARSAFTKLLVDILGLSQKQRAVDITAQGNVQNNMIVYVMDPKALRGYEEKPPEEMEKEYLIKHGEYKED